MQDKDTNICSSSITRTYKIAQGNTSMPYFKITGLILNFNPILCHVDRYLKLSYANYLLLPYYNWQLNDHFMKVRHNKSDIMTRTTKIHQEQTGPVKNNPTRDSWNISLQVQTDPMQYSEGDSPQTGTATSQISFHAQHCPMTSHICHNAFRKHHSEGVLEF